MVDATLDISTRNLNRTNKKLMDAAKNSLIKDYHKNYVPRPSVLQRSDKFISFMKLVKYKKPILYKQYIKSIESQIAQIRKAEGKFGITQTMKKIVSNKQILVKFCLTLFNDNGIDFSEYVPKTKKYLTKPDRIVKFIKFV